MLVPIILAAGASSRMGFPKALLNIEDKSALETILEKCRSAAQTKPIVVLGAHGKTIRENIKFDAIDYVINKNWRAGQTSSVQAGIRKLPASAQGFILWPVDLPLVPVEVLQTLLTAFTKQSNQIIVPKYKDKRGHPAIFPIALKDEILALDDSQALHHVVRKDAKRVCEVVVASSSVIKDLDTPQEYNKQLR